MRENGWFKARKPIGRERASIIGRLISVFVLLSLVLTPIGPGASADVLKQAIEEGKALSRSGRHREAAEIFDAAIRYNLAAIHQSLGDHTKAELLLKSALPVFEWALGADSTPIAESLDTLATVHLNQGRLKDAEPLYERALILRQQYLGPVHPEVANSLSHLGSVQYFEGRYHEAKELLKRALEIRMQGLGPDHEDVAGSLANLAAFYHVQSRYAEAEFCLKRALEIRERNRATLRGSLFIAANLDTLAALFETQGRSGEATPLRERALRIWEQSLGAGENTSASQIRFRIGTWIHSISLAGNHLEARNVRARATAALETYEAARALP